MLERSKQKAKEWVAKAIEFYKASGREIALAEFTNPHGPFVQNKMYIFVLDSQGNMVAHGVNEKYADMNFINLKDSRERTSSGNRRSGKCERQRLGGLPVVQPGYQRNETQEPVFREENSDDL